MYVYKYNIKNMEPLRKTTSIFPDSQKETYGNGVENINVTLIIPDGRAYVKNTLRVSGEVDFYEDYSTDKRFKEPTATEFPDNVFYDNRIGMHSLFRAMYISTDSGLNTSIDEYPTWVKHLMLRTTDNQNYCGSALRELELCVPTIRNTQAVTSLQKSQSFMIYPKVSLNLCDMSSGNITDRVGKITLTLTTNNILSILGGSDGSEDVNPLSSAAGYDIKNLKIHYDTEPTQPNDTQTRLLNIFHAKHTINTGNDVMSINLPLVASSFVASYKPVNVVNTAEANEYQMVNPDLVRLEVTYNNNNNDIISYPLKSDEEILVNSINALNLGNKTPTTLGMTSKNFGKEFTIGLNFGESIDMKKAKLSVRSETTKINNTNKFFLDLYAVGNTTL